MIRPCWPTQLTRPSMPTTLCALHHTSDYLLAATNSRPVQALLHPPITTHHVICMHLVPRDVFANLSRVLHDNNREPILFAFL